MASAERRARYTAHNSFTQGFQIPLNSSDHPSPVSEKLVSDGAPSDSINDQIHANSDKLPDMKWWLHVKSNLGGKANYSTCQNLNYCETELGSFYAEFLEGDAKSGGDQSVNELDHAFSYTGSANLYVEKPWYVSSTCMKNNNNTRMQKIEASLNNNDLHFTPKKKDQKELCFSDGHFMDCDISNFLVYEKMTSSDLESHLMGTEKQPGPWWRTAGKDELASLVAQKSLEHIENCDLPHPQPKHFRQRYTKGVVDHVKSTPSSLNQKAETGSSHADCYTSGTPTCGCSFQDSNSHSR